MIRAIARQAEAERERRAKIINAEGEQQAAQKLLEAARILSGQPEAMQLRYLSSLNVIAGEKNSTIVFPVPLEFGKLLRTDKERSEEHTSELQSLMRISYAVFCLKKKKETYHYQHTIASVLLLKP